MTQIPTRFEISKLSQHEKVMLFVEKFGVELKDTKQKRLLLFKLLLEEVFELALSLGLSKEDFEDAVHAQKIWSLEQGEFIDLGLRHAKIGTLDAIADMRYYEEQLLKMLGVDALIDEAMTEVTYSNLTKLGDDGNPVISDGSDGNPVGKIIKSKNYKKPDIAYIVDSAGFREF